MKKQALRIFTMVSFLTVFAVASAYANTEGRMKVSIPFAFTLGDKTLPAGQYTVERNQLIPELLIVRSVDSDAIATGFTSRLQTPTTLTQAKLVFRRYGNQYFLAQVWRMSSGGVTFRKSRAERAAATGAAKNLAKTEAKPEFVSIATQ